MEKAVGFAGGSVQPSAPPPTAPPSYEEAVGNVTYPPPQPNIPPYPVGPSTMPVPSYNQPPNQTTMPYPPNYSGSGNPSNQSTTPFLPNYPRVPGEPSSQPQPQPQPQLQPQPPPHNANQNFAPPSEAGRIFVSTSYAISPNPVKMTCPTCHTSIKTATISDHQPSAHICCIVLCLLGCCLCSCLPYCMSSFMSVHHFCPNCKNYIGTWKG